MKSLLLSSLFSISLYATVSQEPLDNKVISMKDVGYALVDLEKNQIVEHQNLDRLFIPASVSKVFVAIAGLNYYGAAHKFKTKVFAKGENLYLRGASDPSVSYENYEKLAKTLASYKNLYIDDSITPRANNISTYFNRKDVYNPSISALNFSRSRIPVFLNNDMSINKYFLTKSTQLNFDYLVKASEDLYSLKEKDGTIRWSLNYERVKLYNSSSSSEFIPLDSIPMLNSWSYAGEYFAKLLGSDFKGASKVPTSARVVAELEGDSVHEMMENLLLKSDNSYAEMISSRLAYDRRAPVNNLKDVAQELTSYWNSAFPKINIPRESFVRSSGLSPFNLLSPRHLVNFMSFFHYRPLPGNYIFRDYLSVSGTRGEREEEILDKDLRGLIYSKSGYLHYVRGLSGYLKAASGKMMAFSIFVNDKKSRSILNDPSHKQYSKVLSTADQWAKDSGQFRDSLLKKWINAN